MTLDTSPVDADFVPVNGTRNDVLSQLKISLSNIKSYVLGTLFNTSSGHDHDGTDSKQISASNISGLFSAIYPIGSIYMSVKSTNPSTLFGGTWQAWGAGRVPVGFDSSQSEFDTVEETGGSKTHSHKYGLQYGGYYNDTVLENDVNSGSLIYDSSGNITVTGTGTNIGVVTTAVNNNTATGTKSVGATHYRMIGQSEYISSLQPYITCYMWKRTA